MFFIYTGLDSDILSWCCCEGTKIVADIRLATEEPAGVFYGIRRGF